MEPYAEHEVTVDGSVVTHQAEVLGDGYFLDVPKDDRYHIVKIVFDSKEYTYTSYIDGHVVEEHSIVMTKSQVKEMSVDVLMDTFFC